MEELILAYVREQHLDDEAAEAIKLDAGTRLISTGIIDSFSMVSLKLFLERKYRIVIPDDEATPGAFDTVASIAELVRKQQAAE
jgi:acyl carrier protein